MQSPDDLEATYRCKNQKESRGQSINIVETAHPDNAVNLMADVSVHANNIDDSAVLEERLDHLAEKTPDVEELHFDGGYGSEPVDQKLEDLDITGIQTAIRGNRCKVTITIDQRSTSLYQVSCPSQSFLPRPARKRQKAQFDVRLCKRCPLSQ